MILDERDDNGVISLAPNYNREPSYCVGELMGHLGAVSDIFSKEGAPGKETSLYENCKSQISDIELKIDKLRKRGGDQPLGGNNGLYMFCQEADVKVIKVKGILGIVEESNT